MEQVEWTPTNDGEGYRAEHKGYRLVVKNDDGWWWWGIYEGDDLLDDGNAPDETSAMNRAVSNIDFVG